MAPDGSTVVNIYYDRDLMAINFYYKSNSNAPSGATTAYTYTKTDETSGSSYYGLTPDGYKALDKTSTPETYYTYTYRYNPTTDRNASGMYGVVNNEYVPLTSQTVYTWTPEYVYTPVDKSTYHDNGYAVYNGEYVTAYYKSGTWYRSRSWSWFSYEYSDPVAADATIYSAAEGTEPYDGTRYKRSGNTYTVATNNSGTQYMVDDRGGHVPLTRPTIYLYTYNGVSYTGQRYTRTTNTDYSTEYHSTRYKKVNGAMVALGEDESYSGTIYGIDENLYYAQIELRSQTVITWRINGEKYTGPRYTRSSKSGYMLTWTGLYGQTFAQNGYSWSTVNAYSWTNGTTNQTLLDGFTEQVNPYDLERGAASSSRAIYHYKQKLDGTYGIVDDGYVAFLSSSSTSSSFTFTNKFDSFTVAGYSTAFNTNFDPEHPGNGEHAVAPDDKATFSNTPVYIYHTRNAFELTLTEFRTTNNSPGQPTDKVIEGIKFEQPLSTLTEAELTPPPRENFTFEGWYYDKAFTKQVNFDEAYMPDGNLILYAKWVYKYYFVEIDPNGGEIEDALEFSAYTGFDSPRKQSTYTWVQFGNKIGAYDNVERRYIPDPNGEYRYVNVKFAETFAQAAEKSWDYSLPSKYRAAFYCKADELETVYNEHFSDYLDHDFFMNCCVDQTQLYRKCSGQEGFTLAAWYKVNDDGTTSHDIYNFGDTVTKPTRIRAVWRKSGEYTIEYNPYMRRYAVGGYVEQDGVMHHNETHIDPSEGTKYTDEATATIYTHPNYIPDGYIFRGWQLLDSRLHETGQYYNPRSEFTINSSYADNNGVIHFEAAYEPDKESVRRVDTVSLVLDANTETGGYVVKNGLDVYEDYAYVDLTQNQVLLKKQPNNVAVNLHDYYNNFHNSSGYMLIGWNDTPTAEHFIPKYPADAVIGVDSKNMPQTNKLYAIWEPMYYLTLENHSTDCDVSFNLKFTDYNGVVYSNDTNDVVSVFEREVFSTHNADNLTVTKKGDGEFDVTLNKADAADAPNGVKLVLPQGDQARYTVSGNIQGTPNLPIYNAGKTLTVFNSGGANDTANRTNPDFSVNGSMIHSEEGQTVAFYTEDLPKTKISLKACYYDPTTGTWVQDDDASDSTGPNPTLSFEDIEGITPAADNSITLDIMQQHTKTFSINESFANTAQYKFIGWFSKDSAAPRDRSIDNREFGNAKVTGLTATNDPEKNYYALYVPYSDGTLTLSHDESQTSIGYPKRLSIEADYGEKHARHEIETHIEIADSITHEKVHTGITFENFREPRTDAEAQTAFNIDLEAMSGYGCVHYNTYEEGRALDRSTRIVDDSTIINVYIDPDVTDETPHDGVPVETKHYYRYELNRTVGDMFTDSETVKGYKTIKNIRFYSDFERKYEFVYNYIFRDGTTVRKYQVKDATAYLKSEKDFKQFVFESAPYISNFGEDFVWKPDTIEVNNLYGKGQVTATMDAVQTKSATAHVIVKRFDASIPWAIDVGTAFPRGKRPTADLIINGQQFLRWKVEDTNTEKLIGYCYSPEFSFVVWGDYTITPEYVPMTGDEYEYIAPTDENDCYVTLDYLDSTRNQWVGLDENNNIIVDAKGVATQHYDSLISDFSMVFVDQGKRINADADNYKLGLILEVVGEIENTNIPDQYTVTPSDDATKTRALNAIINSNRTSGYLNNPDGTVQFYFSKIDPSKLSDANRIEFYRGIDNLLGTNGELNPNAKNVFHAYAYMKLPDGTIKLSDPVTLQMYELAVRTVTG